MVKLSYMSLVRLIETISKAHPNVKDFFCNRYDFSAKDNIQYAAIVLDTEDISINNNVTAISFRFIYADRLTATRCNCLQVQTEGIRILSEIINAIRNFDSYNKDLSYNFSITIPDYSINVFREGFADSTAGAFADVSMSFASEIGACDWIENIDICKCFSNG